MDKFEKVKFFLRLSATKQEHKFLLLSNHLDELYTHLVSFVVRQIPQIQSASYGYYPRIHKVINDLPDYALIKKLKAAAMEKKNVEQENKRAEGIWRQTKAQRQLAEETVKRNQTPLEYMLSTFPKARIPIVMTRFLGHAGNSSLKSLLLSGN